MSDSISKTKALERVFIKTSLLDPNLKNPNEMTDAEFNMLSDNIEKMGITDPVLVRPLPNGRYRIVGGHHRWEVAKLNGFEEVPCTVVTAEDFDEDQEAFQVVRMNTIRGHLSPEKFMTMYQTLSSKYADAVMAESFGFASEEEFRKLIGQVKKGLPKEMQKDFQQAAQELKTIQDLSKLLNSLFTRYGDTLPFGYLCFDFGGKDSMWLRMSSARRKDVLLLGKMCVENSRTMDDIVGGLLTMAAQGKLSQQLVQLIAQTEPVTIPDGIDLPTAEVLAGQPH